MSDEKKQPQGISHDITKIQGSQDNKRKSDVVQEAKQILKTAQQDNKKKS